ncbi:unnamed protein product, partial [Mesorhabditis spiculigera]
MANLLQEDVEMALDDFIPIVCGKDGCVYKPRQSVSEIHSTVVKAAEQAEAEFVIDLQHEQLNWESESNKEENEATTEIGLEVPRCEIEALPIIFFAMSLLEIVFSNAMVFSQIEDKDYYTSEYVLALSVNMKMLYLCRIPLIFTSVIAYLKRTTLPIYVHLYFVRLLINWKMKEATPEMNEIELTECSNGQTQEALKRDPAAYPNHGYTGDAEHGENAENTYYSQGYMLAPRDPRHRYAAIVVWVFICLGIFEAVVRMVMVVWKMFANGQWTGLMADDLIYNFAALPTLLISILGIVKKTPVPLYFHLCILLFLQMIWMARIVEGGDGLVAVANCGVLLVNAALGGTIIYFDLEQEEIFQSNGFPAQPIRMENAVSQEEGAEAEPLSDTQESPVTTLENVEADLENTENERPTVPPAKPLHGKSMEPIITSSIESLPDLQDDKEEIIDHSAEADTENKPETILRSASFHSLNLDRPISFQQLQRNAEDISSTIAMQPPHEPYQYQNYYYSPPQIRLEHHLNPAYYEDQEFYRPLPKLIKGMALAFVIIGIIGILISLLTIVWPHNGPHSSVGNITRVIVMLHLLLRVPLFLMCIIGLFNKTTIPLYFHLFILLVGAVFLILFAVLEYNDKESQGGQLGFAIPQFVSTFFEIVATTALLMTSSMTKFSGLL